jgi:Na+-transporting NADH:ubiquinone oxidoreductase subunit NqrC
MNNNSTVKRISLTIILALISSTLLSGCGESLSALPDEQRYKRINAVIDVIDLESAGQVKISRYDTGDGVFSPSFYLAYVDGENSYDNLKKQIQIIPDTKCNEVQTIQLSCTLPNIDISLTRETNEATETRLQVQDIYGGREEK